MNMTTRPPIEIRIDNPLDRAVVFDWVDEVGEAHRRVIEPGRTVFLVPSLVSWDYDRARIGLILVSHPELRESSC